MRLEIICVFCGFIITLSVDQDLTGGRFVVLLHIVSAYSAFEGLLYICYSYLASCQ